MALANNQHQRISENEKGEHLKWRKHQQRRERSGNQTIEKKNEEESISIEISGSVI